jgi:hypothetical protein
MKMGSRIPSRALSRYSKSASGSEKNEMHALEKHRK